MGGLTGGYRDSCGDLHGRSVYTDEEISFQQPCLIPCLAKWLLGGDKAYSSVEFTAGCTHKSVKDRRISLA